ncbi:MAG: hypothetical protein JXA74_10070 [Anaerolineae bacterium]|nr:hypothetical protein [Anaerolineae bacterium]
MSDARSDNGELTDELLDRIVAELWPQGELYHLTPEELAHLAELSVYAPRRLQSPGLARQTRHLARCEECADALVALAAYIADPSLPTPERMPEPDPALLAALFEALPHDLQGRQRLALAVRLLEGLGEWSQRLCVLLAKLLERVVERQLERSKRRAGSLSNRLRQLETLRARVEAQIESLLDWARDQLSDDLRERIWGAEWLSTSQRGKILDVVISLTVLARDVGQPIQEMLLELRLNRVAMRQTVLKRELQQTQQQHAALTRKLEELRARQGVTAPGWRGPSDALGPS